MKQKICFRMSRRLHSIDGKTLEIQSLNQHNFVLVVDVVYFGLIYYLVVHYRYCDNNNFGGILDMETLDKVYALYLSNMLISMVNNNITGLMPNNGTYSPVL